MTVVAFERLRVRYEQGNRASFWVLLALAVAVLMSRHITPQILVGRFDDQLLTAADVLATMPVLFAAAVLAAPRRRTIVTGATFLAAAAAMQGTRHLSPLLGGDPTVLTWLGLVVGPLLVAGPLFIGHGLGGVHTRLGAALVVGGLVVAVLAAVFAVSQPLLRDLSSEGPVLVVSLVIYQFTYLGWAYLLAAAVERRAAWLAVGAGLLITVNLAALPLDVFLRSHAPGFVLPEAGTVFLLLSLAAWVSLIAGVLREVDAVPATSSLPTREATST